MTNNKQVDGNRNREKKEMAALPPSLTHTHRWCGDEMKGYKRKEEKERGRS
jgi:hypothetical protein